MRLMSTAEKKKKILLWGRSGMGVKEIARRLGVSVSYARILEGLAEQAAEAGQLGGKQPLNGLSTRACNALLSKGLKTRAHVAKAFAANELSHIPNLGKVTLREIEIWLAKAQPAASVTNDLPAKRGI